jgi:hypothetical protein
MSLGIHHGSQGAEETGSDLRGEVPIGPDHPVERGRSMEVPSCLKAILSIGIALLLGQQGPVAQHPVQICDPMGTGGIDQDRLRT